jgi:hypothetical protein
VRQQNQNIIQQYVKIWVDTHAEGAKSQAPAQRTASNVTRRGWLANTSDGASHNCHAGGEKLHHLQLQAVLAQKHHPLDKVFNQPKHSGSLNSNVRDKHAEWKGTQSCVASYEAAATVVLL